MQTRKKKRFFLLFVSFVLVFFIPLLVPEVGLSASITLEDVIKMALVNNKQILDSQANLEIAQLNLERAEKLFGSPQINLNLNPWRGYYDEKKNFESSAQFKIGGAIKFSGETDISLNYEGAYDYESGNYDDFYSLELHQSLFQDRSLSPSAIELYNAHKSVEKARLDLEQIQKEIILTTVKSFYEILEISDSLNLVKKKIVLNQEKLEETIRKKESGLVGQLDILEAKIELEENTKQLSKLENQLALAKDQFYHSIGAEKDSLLIFSLLQEKKLREKVEKLLVKEVTEEIILSQSEFKKAQWTIDEKRLELSKKEKDTSASWSLSIGYTSKKSTLESISPGQWQESISPGQWQGNVGMSYNLFDAGRAKLLVETAQIDMEKAERNFENLKEDVQFNLYSQRDALKEFLSQLNLLKLRREQARLRGQLAKEQFALGIISSREIKEFQLQKIQQENSYQSALHELLTSYFSYQLSLGMNIDFDEVISK